LSRPRRRAGTGHDISAVCTFDAISFKDHLEPLNDVAEYLEGKYGKFDELATYLSHQEGKWITLPAPTGSHSYPMVSRIDLWREHVDFDVQKVFPTDAGQRDPAMVDGFNYGFFLEACKKLHKAGYPFGGAISETSDANDWLCPLMLSFGSEPVDKDGNIVIESDETLAGLEFMKELVQYMPQEVYGWDDASSCFSIRL
jgi:ABC-type glycerol-3-phosphate transport system substrate-binding protein